MVVERCYFRYPKALLALVVKEQDMCIDLLLVEEIYPRFVDLLDDDHREQPPVDRGPGLGKVEVSNCRYKIARARYIIVESD